MIAMKHFRFQLVETQGMNKIGRRNERRETCKVFFFINKTCNSVIYRLK